MRALISLMLAILTLFFASPEVIAQVTTPEFTKEDLNATIGGFTDYDPTSSGASANCSIGEPTTPNTGSVMDYANRPIISDEQLSTIRQNQPFYERAASASDIPWQMIAVIHMNESGLSRSNPSNGQGVYQFVNRNGGPYPTGPVSDAEFQRQTILAAEFIRGKVAGNEPANRTLTAANPSLEAVKDTFFGYNGRSSRYADQAANLGFDRDSQPYEGSPYVMNKADSRRDPTAEPTISNDTWGQVKRDFGPIEYPANNFYGAFVQFAALFGVQTSSQACQSLGAQEGREGIVNIARAEFEAWESGTLVPGSGYHKYSQGRNEEWCADFVSWVYDKAGQPLINTPGGNVPAVDTIRQIGVNNGRFHAADGSYAPQPGDIIVFQSSSISHVNLVISVSGDSMETIGGNQNGNGNHNASRVTQYTESMSNSDIVGYVSPE